MKTNWVEMWFDDKDTILSAMRRNLASDIEAGYNVRGFSVRKQLVQIEEYEREYREQADRIREMEPGRANHWCYVDLRKRGAIG